METYTSIPEDLKLAVLEKIKPTEAERKKLTGSSGRTCCGGKSGSRKTWCIRIFL